MATAAVDDRKDWFSIVVRIRVGINDRKLFPKYIKIDGEVAIATLLCNRRSGFSREVLPLRDGRVSGLVGRISRGSFRNLGVGGVNLNMVIRGVWGESFG